MAGCENFLWESEFCKEHWKQDCEHRIRIADEVTENYFLFDLPWDMERTYEPVVFKDEIDWEYQQGDDPEYIYQMNRHRYFICLGQAYAMTGDEKYAKCFAELLLDWRKRVPLTKASKNTTWRTIEAGLRGENWTKAFAYFKDSSSVTEAVKESYFAGLREHCEYIVEIHDAFRIQSNWGVLENSGLFAMAVALQEEFGKSERVSEYLEIARERLENSILLQVMEDGTHWEQSGMYHNEVLHCYLEFLHLARKVRMQLQAITMEKIAAMAEVNICFTKPNGCQLTAGDSDETPMGDVFTKAAFLLASPKLKTVSYAVLDYESVWEYGEAGQKQYEEVAKEQMREILHYLPDSGNITIRSSWDKNANYLHMKNGFLGGGHGHADRLHLDLCLDGEDVLVDPGRYTYVNCEKRRYLKGPKGHNTILVDDASYLTCYDSWGVEPSDSAHSLTGRKTSYGYLLKGMHGGYIAKGCLAERSVAVVGDGIYIIADVVRGKGKHSLTQLFHMAPQISMEKSESGIHFHGVNASGYLYTNQKENTIEIKDADCSYHYNQIEKAPLIEIKAEGKKTIPVLTVIAANTESEVVKSIQEIPVHSCMKSKAYKRKEAQAVEIITSKRRIVAMFSFCDVAGPHDSKEAGGYRTMGNVMVEVQLLK